MVKKSKSVEDKELLEDLFKAVEYTQGRINSVSKKVDEFSKEVKSKWKKKRS